MKASPMNALSPLADTTLPPLGVGWWSRCHGRRALIAITNRIAFAANRKEILTAIGQAASRVVVEFAGDHASAFIEPPRWCGCLDGTLGDRLILFQRSDHDGLLLAQGLALTPALELLTSHALEHYHPGWELDEGCHGHLTVDPLRQTITLACQPRAGAAHQHIIGGEG